MTKIKAVSFDVGGTLLKVTPSVEEIYHRLFAAAGCRREAREVGEIMRRSLEEYERKIFKRDLELATDDKEEEDWWHRLDTVIAERCGVKGDLTRLCRQLWEEFLKVECWEVYPDVIPALNQLRGEGYKVGVTTNWNSQLPRILNALNLMPLFDFFVISTQVGYKKPSPKIFKKTVQSCGAAAAGEVAHVGDHLEADYQGALRAGLRAVLLTREKRSEVQGPVISSLAQLPKVLAEGIDSWDLLK